MARPRKRRDRDELPPGCRWKGTSVEWRRMRRGAKESRVFSTPTDAWEFVRDLEAVERSAALGIVQTTSAPRDVSVADICDWYQRTYLDSSRLRKRSARLDAAAAAFGKIKLAELGPKDVADWIRRTASEPVTRKGANGERVVVHVKATGAPKLRGPGNLSDYLSELSAALTWHARDHGYAAEGERNAALQAAPGLRKAGVIGRSRKRKTRLKSDEQARLFDAARRYVSEGKASVVTRQRTPRKWDVGLALELGRLAPITGRRITELVAEDVELDVAGRAVAVRLRAGGELVKIPRRLGRELEAILRERPGERLFPVGRQEPPKALTRLCNRLDLPALMWQGLASFECSASDWKRIVFESRRDRDTYEVRGRQRLDLPLVEFYRFALAMAFRPGEIADLRWADIELGAEPEVHLVHDPASGRYLKGKESDDRRVPLRREAIEVLESLTTYRSPTARVFGASYATFQQRHKQVRKLAGMESYTLHMLRHEALSRLGEAGFGLPDLKVFSGHSDVRELNTYIHGSVESLARRLALLDGEARAA